MPRHILKRGLDLPMTGAAASDRDALRHPGFVALIAADTVGLKPKMLVGEGDVVRRGTPLFCHKDSPEVMFTAPATGRVLAIHRGARRVLQSVVIAVQDAADPGRDFGAVAPGQIAGCAREDVAQKIQAAGLWPAFRTRPYSKLPAADAVPAAIFVTALDSEPLSPEAAPIIAGARASFATGLIVLTRLTEGAVYLCQAPGENVAGAEIAGVEMHEFDGPHPAGLAGTHMHFLAPPSAQQLVWSIGYQDVIAMGRLFETGHLDPTRIVALCGPRAGRPRLLQTFAGAAIAELTEGEVAGNAPCRIISGSVLTGRVAEGPFAYLGRYDRQITLMTEDPVQHPFGWITPQPNKYAVQPVLASAFGAVGRLFDLTTNMHGGRRAMVPTGTFETLMPQDFLPTQLLRALLVGDTDAAQSLGALELDEEDLALCTFACPAKYEYGEALRRTLARIEKEG